jgi:GAF domain-containing protein
VRVVSVISLAGMSIEGYINSVALDRGLSALEHSLADLRARGHDVGLSESLNEVIGATRTLFGATGAGIMMVNDASVLAAVAATDEGGRLLETRQEEAGEGPCVETLLFDQVVRTPDLAADERWPKLGAEMREAGVRAVLGIPLHVDSIAVGALNVYWNEPHGWDESEVGALEAYGRVVENLLRAAMRAREREQLADQLQHALDNRVVIERAVGVIMQRDQVSAVAAFNQLRQTARSSQTKAAHVAQQLLAELGTNA